MINKRPLSYSAISSFEYDKEQWYKKYILGEKLKETPELKFGKVFAKSCEDRCPLAPVTLLDKMEHKFSVVFDDIPLVGFADTWDDKTHLEGGEYKTGVQIWNQKRVDEHEQITIYLLMNYITHKINPDSVRYFLEWVPTKKIERSNGDFSGEDYEIAFVTPITVRRFETKRTMTDILRYGAKIKRIVKEMEDYVNLRKTYASV